MKTTEAAFNYIMQSALFRLNGEKIDLCASLITLADAIKAEEETNWSLGESLECSLDSLIVGAYWSLTEWHAGQASDSYAAMCALGAIFSPGMSSAPTGPDDGSEWDAYQAVNEYFEKLNA